MDGVFLTCILILYVLPAVCLGIIIASFRIKKTRTKIQMIVPSALGLAAIVYVWWALRQLAGIK